MNMVLCLNSHGQEAHNVIVRLNRSVMHFVNNAGLEDSIRSGDWAEYVRTTTFIADIAPIKTKKCP
jgi:hypothetical protein